MKKSTAALTAFTFAFLSSFVPFSPISRLSAAPVPGPDLTVGTADVRVIQSPEGGYHLYIRKKPGIGSVLLTETTRDPSLKSDNYAYRALEWNAINGDEKRMLDGAIIPADKKIWSLIDSTPADDPVFGQSFHIWIPWVVAWGYSWSRNGETQVLDGTYLNIRAFAKPFGDYAGAFADNPFRLRVTQKPVPKPVVKAPEAPPETPQPEEPPIETVYMKDTVEAFTALAQATDGVIKYARSPDDIVPLIRDILTPAGEKPLDLVFVLDATESMKDDTEKVRELLEPLLKELLPAYPAWRIGLVLYKDYFEDFLVKAACPFTDDLGKFRKALGAYHVQGGRDIPEAVYEALDGALAYPWNPEADKRIVLIGDAPPHLKPRGKITKDAVYAKAADTATRMDVIILPHGETY